MQTAQLLSVESLAEYPVYSSTTFITPYRHQIESSKFYKKRKRRYELKNSPATTVPSQRKEITLYFRLKIGKP